MLTLAKHLRGLEEEYARLAEAYKQARCEVETNGRFMLEMGKKLKNTNAYIVSIEKNRNGEDTFICVADMRKMSIDYETLNPYMRGTVHIFIMNKNINPISTGPNITNMPYLMATFFKDSVRLDELHSFVYNKSYENVGYGTLLLETLKVLAKKSGCASIYGQLSCVDANTDKQRDKRNNFYRNRGFEIKFSDDSCRDGSFSLLLN